MNMLTFLKMDIQYTHKRNEIIQYCVIKKTFYTYYYCKSPLFVNFIEKHLNYLSVSSKYVIF